MKRKPLVLGVAGGTGSGKSTVVRSIAESLGPSHAVVIQHDLYYRDHSGLTASDRNSLNFDHPDALETSLLAQHLRQLLAGQVIQAPQYDFSSHRRMESTIEIEPRPVIILEGILVLAQKELRELIDIRAFVDAPDDVRFIRRLKRDLTERGRSLESVVKQYLDSVRPMHVSFVEPSRRHAHIILPGGSNQVAIDLLLSRIRAFLEE
ncbi:MAG TPA: uridine kinase [Acidobacteriota bacterium]|nr:uridine kinase [Acidobacteriota bacterium]